MSTFDDLVFAPVYVVSVEGRQKGLFRAHKGKRLIAADRKAGTTPFVGGSRVNNSITDFADTPVLFPGGWVTLIYNGDGGTGHAKYQPAPFSASDDVIALEPVSHLASEPALLLIASMLTQQCVPKFGFGYKLTLQRLDRQKIMAPVITDADGDDVVDWDGLTSLGKKLLLDAKTSARAALESGTVDTDALPTLRFEPMFINEIFPNVKASSAWYDKVSLKAGAGRNLYLSQTRYSNSVAEIVAAQAGRPEPGNCITMTLKTQATFYQPNPFYTAQNFLIFRHPKLDVDSGMIVVTALRRATKKFSWGYGVSMARLNKTRIMVPVITDDNGEKFVDWEGMRDYGRALRVRAEWTMNTVLEAL